MKEEWRDIEGYSGLYQVSNCGRVKSVERTVRTGRGYRIVPEKILKGIDNNVGYLYVNLYKDGKVKKYSIHRLVATTFIENPNNLPVINHKDENKENNCSSNLEWCSVSYNNNYNGRAKRVAEKLSKPVYSINKESGLITYWESINDASRQLNINKGGISACCRGKCHSYGGYIWRYIDDKEACNEQE